MVQFDVTSPWAAAAGGAGGAAFGVQAYRKGEVERQADLAAIANRAKVTDLAQQELEQRQSQFERTSQFREKLATQRDRLIEQSRTSGRNSALSQLASLQGTAETEAGKEGLAPELVQKLNGIKQGIAASPDDPAYISPEDAPHAIQAWGILATSVIHGRAVDELKAKVHNSMASGAFVTDENGDGQPDVGPEIINGWLDELSTPGVHPQRVAEIQRDLEGLQKQHDLERNRKVFREQLITKRSARLESLMDGPDSGPFVEAGAVLAQLQRGEFQRKDGTDDLTRFDMHFNAAAEGKVVIDHPQYGEIAVLPAQADAMVRGLKETAQTPEAKASKIASAMSQFIKPYDPAGKQSIDEWKQQADGIGNALGFGRMFGTTAPEPKAPEPGLIERGVDKLKSMFGSTPAAPQGTVEERVAALPPEKRAAYDKRVAELRGQTTQAAPAAPAQVEPNKPPANAAASAEAYKKMSPAEQAESVRNGKQEATKWASKQIMGGKQHAQYEYDSGPKNSAVDRSVTEKERVNAGMEGKKAAYEKARAMLLTVLEHGPDELTSLRLSELDRLARDQGVIPP